MKTLAACLFLLVAIEGTFAAGKQLSGQHAPATATALSPADAQKSFTVPAGFEVRLFAAEPDVVNPVAMTWDERGRLWVLELYEYPLGAPAGTKPRDRIKILEDTDNDGRADRVTVFADGLNLATGLLLGNGGAYVGQAPDLLFLQDTNHDDIADTRTVLLTGFGLDDRHELLNGFTWGPDGYLYLTHGVFTHSKVKIPEASAPGVEVTAAVARFQPKTKKFEVFADGTSNPWGVDFDRYGNAFVSACVIDHLFHMAPGGIYVRQGGTPANPYAYELLPSIVDHKHHMAAYCGICIYQGNNFPVEYQDHVLMGNIHQNAINHDRLVPNGSSFKALAEKDFLTTTDGWFRPVSEQVGPDGALWVADWYDKYPCYQNAQADPEGVDRQYGRIWRVVYTGEKPGSKVPSRPETKMDLSKADIPGLVKLLEHPNVWQRRMAQRLLTERKSASVTPLLLALLQNSISLESQLAALWTLHCSDGLDEATLDKLTTDAEPAVRAWAARLTGERAQSTEQAIQRLTSLAADKEPTVRLAVATAARQFVSGSLTVDTPPANPNPGRQMGPIMATLVRSSADGRDPLLPFMIWMASEPVFVSNSDRALNWLTENGEPTMPLSGILARKMMRRLCDTQEKAQLAVAAKFLSGLAERNSTLLSAALDGLLEGQKAKPFPPDFDTKKLFEALSANPEAPVRERARALGTLWGDAASVEASLRSINDSNLSVDERIKAINAATALKTSAVGDALLQTVRSSSPEPVTIAALRALGQFEDDRVAHDLLSLWSNLSPAARSSAAEVLVLRRRWAMALLSAVETKQITPAELPMGAIRSLADNKDDFVRQRAGQAIGRIRPANTDKQKLIEQMKTMILAGGPLDPNAGHDLVKKTCLVCHKLYGEGAEVGPDLTGVGRSTLDALLANVIDPSQVVGKGYENVMIETKDGRNLSGRIVENTDTRVKLLSSGPKEDVVAKSDIAEMRISELSVMPEGLEQMPEQDFRNLILYVLRPPQEAGRHGH